MFELPSQAASEHLLDGGFETPQPVVEAQPQPASEQPLDRGSETPQPVYEPPAQTASEQPEVLQGRRIVDIGYLFRRIISIRHKPFNCTIADMITVGERRKGLSSIVILKCRMCGLKEEISTEDPNKKDEYISVNAAAVSGIMATGGGFAQLEELTAVLDIPCMAKNTYAKNHEKVYAAVHKTAWQLMQEAGQEEARLARERGDVDQDGVPLITVVADGAWSKRSYKTQYNALSGVVSNCI